MYVPPPPPTSDVSSLSVLISSHDGDVSEGICHFLTVVPEKQTAVRRCARTRRFCLLLTHVRPDFGGSGVSQAHVSQTPCESVPGQALSQLAARSCCGSNVLSAGDFTSSRFGVPKGTSSGGRTQATASSGRRPGTLPHVHDPQGSPSREEPPEMPAVLGLSSPQ